MQKIHFSIHIDAPAEKVWNIMFDDATYRKWTKPFNPDSRYEGSWEKGSKIRFFGSLEEGKGEGGMVSYVRENKPYEFLSLEHVGIIENGVEDTTSERIKKFAPAYENYTFLEKDGGTEVSVEMDTDPEYREMLEDAWPKALRILKELSEE